MLRLAPIRLILIPGEGPYTITPLTALPIITGPVTIDGYSQPGSVPNTNLTDPGPTSLFALGSNAVLKIVLNGAGLNAQDLLIEASDCTIRGLAINGFDGDEIIVRSGANNKIQGNFIGTLTITNPVLMLQVVSRHRRPNVGLTDHGMVK